MVVSLFLGPFEEPSQQFQFFGDCAVPEFEILCQEGDVFVQTVLGEPFVSQVLVELLEMFEECVPSGFRTFRPFPFLCSLKDEFLEILEEGPVNHDPFLE